MLSDLLFLVVTLTLVTFGLRYPYIALCGVLWADTFKPQNISYSFLSGLPFSMIFTLVLFLSLIINFKQLKAPSTKLGTVLVVFFMIWFTLSTFNSHFPDSAWIKWNYVFKTFIVITLIPFILQERKHIDIFLAVFIFSVTYYTLTAGIKTLLSGGGYGITLVSSNERASGLVETSSMSMVAVMLLPMIFYLFKYSKLYDRMPYKKYLSIGLAVTCLSAVVGTYARTGLLSLFAAVLCVIYQSKRKMMILVLMLFAAIPGYMSIPDTWFDRMNTMKSVGQEESALGRILVWRWVIDYVSDRPLMGGGFLSYRANAGILNSYTKGDEIGLTNQTHGKSFHSADFEVLGEQGYVGLVTMLLMFALTWFSNRSLIVNPDTEPWKKGLAEAMNISLFTYCVGASFIGVAYQPWVFYLFAISISVHNIDSKQKVQE